MVPPHDGGTGLRSLKQQGGGRWERFRQVSVDSVRYTSRRVASAPSLTACMVAQTSSSTHIIPGGFCQNDNQNTLFLEMYENCSNLHNN